MTAAGITLHQVWWTWRADGSFDDANRVVPFPRYTRLWRRLHPHWHYRLWRRVDAYDYVKTYFPEYLQIFLAYPRHIQRCDLFRLLVLLREGGVYADLDTYPLQSLTALQAQHPQARAIFPAGRVLTAAERSGPVHQVHQVHQMVDNCWMMVPPNHAIVHRLLAALRARAHLPVHGTWDVLHSTGPLLYAEVLAQHPMPDVLLLSEDASQQAVRHLYAQAWRSDTRPVDDAAATLPLPARRPTQVVQGLVQRGLIATPAALIPTSLEDAMALSSRLAALHDPTPEEHTLRQLLHAYLAGPLPNADKLQLVQLWLRGRYPSELPPLKSPQRKQLERLTAALQRAGDAWVAQILL